MNQELLLEDAEELTKYLLREYFDKSKDKRKKLVAIKAMELSHYYDEAEQAKTDLEYE